jgi:uncharacterized protein YdcH (DUF465 family)
MGINLEDLKKMHKTISEEIEELEGAREFDRTTSAKQKLVDLKKQKLKLKDQIAELE